MDLEEPVGDSSLDELTNTETVGSGSKLKVTNSQTELRAEFPWARGLARLLNISAVLILACIIFIASIKAQPGMETLSMDRFTFPAIIGLILLYFGQVSVRNKTSLFATASILKIKHGPLFHLPQSCLNTSQVRQFILRGHAQKELCLVDQEGYVYPICRRFPSLQVAIEVQNALNGFFRLTPEEVARQSDLLQIQETLRPRLKGVTVEEKEESLRFTYKQNRGSAWFILIFMLILLIGAICTALVFSSRPDFGAIIFSDIMLGLCSIALGYVAVAGLINQTEILARPGVLTYRVGPIPMGKREQHFAIDPSCLFTAPNNPKTENKLLYLMSFAESKQLQSAPSPEATATIITELNKFYGLGSYAKEIQFAHTSQDISDPSIISSKLFNLTQSEHSLTADYPRNRIIAFLTLLYSPIMAVFIVLGTARSFSIIPLYSILLFLFVGLPFLSLIALGIVQLFIRTKLVATRHEIELSTIPFSIGKPKRLAPSTVKQWIVRGDPTDMRQTYTAVLAYRDADHDYVPFATQIPSPALAHKLKSSLEAFYGVHQAVTPGEKFLHVENREQ